MCPNLVRHDIELAHTHIQSNICNVYERDAKLFVLVIFVLGEIKEVLSWRSHNQGCPVYGMAYRKAFTTETKAQKDEDIVDIPPRLFTSSCGGEVKEWDPTNGSFQQMTIIKVGRYLY